MQDQLNRHYSRYAFKGKAGVYSTASLFDSSDPSFNFWHMFTRCGDIQSRFPWQIFDLGSQRFKLSIPVNGSDP